MNMIKRVFSMFVFTFLYEIRSEYEQENLNQNDLENILKMHYNRLHFHY